MTNRSVFARALLVAALSVLAVAAAAAEGSDGDRSGAPSSSSSSSSTEAASAAPADAAASTGASTEGAPPSPPPQPAADSAAAGSDAAGVSVAAPSDVISSGSARQGAASLADARFAGEAGSSSSSSRAVSGRSIGSSSGPRSWNAVAAAPAPPPPPPVSAADAGQFHIQTDEGPERYFRYQTQSGQYRKEKRLQDGSVVGSYGWIGADGVLRLRDYVADNSGYRVVRTKSVYVGRDEPIGSALAKSKSAPSQGGTSYRAPIATAPPTPPPLPLSTPQQQQEPIRRPALGYSAPTFSFSPPASVIYPGYQPLSSNAIQPQYSGLPSNYQYQTASPPAADRYDPAAAGYYQNTVQAPTPTQFPLYDGIATTQNGFRYYLPRQYQEEETLSQDRRAGSFGYIDPFGIRRVVYYNTAPETGFVHRKNNRYVGFDATPYDPRY